MIPWIYLGLLGAFFINLGIWATFLSINFVHTICSTLIPILSTLLAVVLISIVVQVLHITLTDRDSHAQED